MKTDGGREHFIQSYGLYKTLHEFLRDYLWAIIALSAEFAAIKATSGESILFKLLENFKEVQHLKKAIYDAYVHLIQRE